MNAKHTPGPWHTVCFDENKLDGNKPCCIKAINRTVAWVDFWQDETYATQIQIAEQAANAALIASAPDLLADNARLREALQECITEDGALAWRSAEFAGQRLEAISNIARAALAGKGEA